MILHLTDGKTLQKPLDAATMGLRLDGITFKGQDMCQLLQMNNEELRERLSILYTRFAPFSQEHAHAQD